MKNIRAIVPAAGKGTRLQSVSGNIPKAMFSVANRPMLDTSHGIRMERPLIVIANTEKLGRLKGNTFISLSTFE